MNAQQGIHQSLGETVYSVSVHIRVGPKEIRPVCFTKLFYEYIKYIVYISKLFFGPIEL